MLNTEMALAINARSYSYAPYSKFNVGCVLKTKSGKIYKGCNIENDGIMSICAERVAFTKAISEGERKFDYIIVCGGEEGGKLEYTLPCGYCRQFMSEFVDKDFKVYVFDQNKILKAYKMEDLLPNNFKL